jgi:hypothetical protein
VGHAAAPFSERLRTRSLNMVEIFFRIITRQVIRGGTFASLKDLITVIETFIDGWNERCQPFIWTKTADIMPRAAGGQDLIYAALALDAALTA